MKKSSAFFFIVFCVASILAFGFWLPRPVHAERVYIDITSPQIQRLPVAVQPFAGNREVSDIIKGDLTFTGLFDCIDDAAQIEGPAQPFSPGNWKGTGTELVVKGRVATSGKDMRVAVFAYDVSTGQEVLRKEYSASSSLVRPLAHAVADEIYRILTGQQGIFRSKIAYISAKGGRSELHLADWDGKRDQGLGVTGGIILTPRWAGDGSKIIYSVERNRQWDISLLDMTTLKERNLVSLKGLNMTGNFFPDGTEFVFVSSKEGGSDIYVGNARRMKGRKLISSPWIDVSPAVSPDGKSILFVSDRSGSPQIYLCDSDGEGVRRLTFSGSYNTSPAWSPRGDLIAFSGLTGGRNQIFVMKPDGSGLTCLTEKGNNEEPSFSPDGRYIAFTSDRSGVKGVYIMLINGEGQQRITPAGVKASGPAWAPR